MEKANENQPSAGKFSFSSSPNTPSPDKGSHTIALQIPQIALPKGGGAIKGIDEKFQVNAANGTASLSLALPFSVGGNGFMPEIVLGYNSGVGNGVFGLGWELGFPLIKGTTANRLSHYRPLTFLAKSGLFTIMFENWPLYRRASKSCKTKSKVKLLFVNSFVPFLIFNRL
ncbi:MAG: hypothetical protein JNK77_03960 [Saprospiraceae bacterium]|nr:hypothetical protein [Saprospiraceae bacterium]